jgi:hemolysin III
MRSYRSPAEPRPRRFGYHEVFRTLVIAAAALHYAVIAFAVLPRG